MTRVERTKTKVLILSGALGDGHMQAAKAITEAFKLSRPEIETKTVDFMEGVHPRTHAIERYGFLQWVKYFPSSYGYLYRKTRSDADGSLAFFLKYFDMHGLKRLLRLLRDERPTLIASTFPLASAAVSLLKAEGLTDLPLATVITDHSDHGYWLHPLTDLYLVSSEDVRSALRSKGVDDRRIEVTGIPVRPVYARTAGQDRSRERLDLAPDAFVVLVMGGGDGMIDRTFVERLRSGAMPPGVQFVFVCGRNASLLRRLRAASEFSDRIRVTGYLKNIHEWMAAADLLITKPGGLTTSEALAAGLPMLLFQPRLEQEKGNADYLLRRGVAQPCRIGDLPAQLNLLLRQPSLLTGMKARAIRHGRPDSAGQAVARIMSLRSESPAVGFGSTGDGGADARRGRTAIRPAMSEASLLNGSGIR